ncbi:MAG: amidohydrolase family protein [Verrucomicrobiota bacterium]
MTITSEEQPIDMHVHLVGNGRQGSGCWLRVRGWWHKPLANFMLSHIGLGYTELQAKDFDRIYVEHLLKQVRESSLSKLVLLAQDWVYDENGKKMEGAGSFYVPNEYVLKLAREHEEFLPAVSIHPGRPDALDELERCLEGGAVMLKLLPNCHNVNGNDKRYTKFWERMAQAGLPLLAHTGGEHTVPVVNEAYSDPRTLQLPLECGVKVIAAHCATKSGIGDPEYFHIFCEMLEKHPNLYGDSSALVTLNRCTHLSKCLRPGLAERVLHGSDFPVPIFGHRLWLRGELKREDFSRCQAIRNVIERDYQKKRALGFQDHHFTQAWKVLRPVKKKR